MRRSHSTMNAPDRGAALLIAIGVLALLLLISVSFFRMATQELQVANNHADNIQAELLVDGAFAIAIDTLQQDAADHPNVTSNDHAWRTKFNGAWAIGKWWASPVDRFGNVHRIYELDFDTFQHRKFPPLVDLDAISFAINQYPLAGPTAKLAIDPEVLHRNMYIPRIEWAEDQINGRYTPTLPGFIDPDTGQVDLSRYLDRDFSQPNLFRNEIFPFAYSTDYAISNLSGSGTPHHPYGLNYNLFGQNPYDPTIALPFRFDSGTPLLPEQQVHFFTDVDTNGDGLNDAMWLPMAADRLFPNDGIDNDLDGYIDEFDPDGEPGVFIYSEGYLRDSDDDVSSRRAYLTVPLDRMFQFRVDEDSPWQPLGVVASDLNFRPDLSGGLIPEIEALNYDLVSSSTLTVDTDYTLVEGDNRDNDFNHIIDDGVDASHYVMNRAARLAAAGNLAGDPSEENFYFYSDLFGKIATALGNGFEVRINGETESELIGRVAIHIEDEASKVNVNAAGGMTYIRDKRQVLNPATSIPFSPMFRTSFNGTGPNEYDLRAMYEIGDERAEQIWNVRMGSLLNGIDPDSGEILSNGSGLSAIAVPGYLDPTGANFELNFGNLAYDVSFPGYGFVDDDGSALWMAINGIDDDGDAYYYQSDGVDNDRNGLIDDPAEGVDEGLFAYDMDGDGFTDTLPELEGIDEPQEYQYFRPYRNIAAELDVDAAALPNFGGTGGFGDNDSDNVPNEIGELGDRPYRTTEQLKILDSIAGVDDTVTFTADAFAKFDPFITAHSSDSNLSFDYQNGFGWANASQRKPSGIKLDINYASPEEIARSLTQNFGYSASQPRVVDGTGRTVSEQPFNNTILDFARGLRQEDTTVVSATEILGLASGDLTRSVIGSIEPGTDIYQQVQFPSDPELRAYQLAVNAKDYADSNFGRTTTEVVVPDAWADNFLGGTGNSISYKQAGVEAVRINEIMVRPVRRIEAEADTGSGDPADPFNPNWFSENIGADDFNFGTRRTSVELSDGDIGGFDVRLVDTVAFGNPPLNPNLAVYDWANDTILSTDLPALGIQSAWATYQSNVRFEVGGFVNGLYVREAFVEMPNLLEFEFRASEQLPAGRYYLTVNTDTVARSTYTNEQGATVNPGDIVNSVFGSQDFIYFTQSEDDLGTFDSIIEKVGVQSIREALGDTVSGTNDILSDMQSPAVVGRDALNNLTGMSFMQSHEMYTGFTVEVPASGALHVAIARTRPDPDAGASDPGTPLAVNYFDFSQEPDHEYIELVNISESEEINPDDLPADVKSRPVDVSGWRIKVKNGAELRIPDDTFIAPGGFLLVGVNKFDYIEPVVRSYVETDTNYDTDLAPIVSTSFEINPLLFRNGIGLARGSVPGASTIGTDITTDWFEQITVPRMFTDWNPSFEPTTIGGADPGGVTGSDFVDNRGDGVHDGHLWFPSPGTVEAGEVDPQLIHDDLVQSTLDASKVAGHNLNLNLLAVPFNKRWDRIVEAEIVNASDFGFYAETAAGVGNYVLAGGVFPNTPEQDGIDNDSDNGTLLFDGIDNDGDGFIDEPGEGFDEGGLRLNPSNIFANLAYPGGYQRGHVPLNLNPSTLSEVSYPIVELGNFNAPLSPPSWKKFVEERLFPGDNVVVTLYTADGTNDEHIVDEISYTELDVTDRAKDDLVPRPGGIPGPNSTLPAMWYPNTMGIDFYKSLERKHPLYNGDKHGTQNRFEATDGAYDDWADSTHYHVRDVEMSDSNNNTDGMFNFDPPSVVDVSNPLLQVSATGEFYEEMFNHVLAGSPLRMNFSQRLIENPSITTTTDAHLVEEFTRIGQFDHFLSNLADVSAPFPASPTQGVRIDRNYLFPEAKIRNRAIVSPGDLFGMPHFDRIERVALNQNGYVFDQSNPSHRFVLDNDGIPTLLYEDTSVRQIMLGQTFGDVRWDENLGLVEFFSLDYRVRDNATIIARNLNHSPTVLADYAPDDEDGSNDLSNDLVQLVGNTAANDSLSLSVATASVVPFGNSLDLNWNVTSQNTPQDWSPVLLFPLSDDNGSDTFGNAGWEVQYLFSNALSTAGIIPNTVLGGVRWPYERRAVAYASRNFAGYDSSLDIGKTALFMWDGNDGLENGEYDLYISVNEDMGKLLNNLAVLDSPFGIDFVEAAETNLQENMKLSVNVLTDRDGDGRVWTSTEPIPSNVNLLNTFASEAGVDEGFGAVVDATPDANGFINYGSVTVENNFLAMLVENRADSSVMNRISRVVLTPRTRTTGRLNINTIETQFIKDTSTPADRYFNPLIGVPAIQYGYDEFLDSFGQNILGPSSPTTNPALPNSPNNHTFFSNVTPRDTFTEPTSTTNTPYVHLRARKIVDGRADGENVHPDGRYYETIADLVLPQLRIIGGNSDSVFREELPTHLSGLRRSTHKTVDQNEELPRFRELRNRFSRIANMVTTKSDVFKIYVTVQTGYIDDVNNDGILNYRDDSEFTTTSEKQATSIYQR